MADIFLYLKLADNKKISARRMASFAWIPLLETPFPLAEFSRLFPSLSYTPYTAVCYSARTPLRPFNYCIEPKFHNIFKLTK